MSSGSFLEIPRTGAYDDECNVSDYFIRRKHRDVFIVQLLTQVRLLLINKWSA